MSAIQDCKKELEDIRNIIGELSPLDKKKDYLTKYALIKACGNAEYVYRAIVADYFNKFSSPQIDLYLDTTVREGSMSAKYDNMCTLLGKFDRDWKTEFQCRVKGLVNNSKLISSSNSLVSNRHAFAHGKNPSATFNEIFDYYLDVLILIDILDQVVNG